MELHFFRAPQHMLEMPLAKMELIYLAPQHMLVRFLSVVEIMQEVMFLSVFLSEVGVKEHLFSLTPELNKSSIRPLLYLKKGKDIGPSN